VPSLRDQLLDATERVLEQDGVAAVTTRRIANEAGCSEGSIYNHFRGKEDLLASAISERVARFSVRITELMLAPGQGEVQVQLREIAELALGFYRRRGAMLAVAHDRPQLLEQHRAHVQQRGGGPWRTLDNLRRWLDAERQLGRVSPTADTAAAATALLGSCLYHAVVAGCWDEELTPDDDTAIDRAVTAVWQGLAPPA
jgi:AcrR family transcriptional regulator